MMESIEKLRELCAKWRKTSITPGRNSAADEVDAIADEIEREIAERYMKLPVDADGVPFKMGDEVVIPKCYEGTVVSIEVGDMDTIIGVDGHDGYLRYDISDVHHVKPRTIEDVLEEFGTRYIWAVETPEPLVGFGNEIIGEQDPRDVIAKYADELRQMGVGDD